VIPSDFKTGAARARESFGMGKDAGRFRERIFDMTRRESLEVLAAPLAASSASAAFDPNFGSALDAAAAIANRKISSVELTQHVYERIGKHQPKLNPFVYLMREEALAQARRADEAVAKGGAHPPLTGVPVVIKESFGIAGRPCTWGIPALKDAKAAANAAANATAVQRLLDAGAVVVGATNVPINLGDEQSYNDIYGTTNNPWDATRTPGGSSGGNAAALAAGMGFLGIGSDIGGSVRGPAHCCGIFGRKPTLDVVSMRGHAPGGERSVPGFSTLLAVAGPMARTAEDLEAAMGVLGGPEPPDSVAYTWRTPAARRERLREFRIGYVLDDPLAPVSSETAAVLESAVRALEKGGAKLVRGWPPAFSLGGMFSTYVFMLSAFTYSTSPAEEQARQRAEFAATKDSPFAAGALADFAAWSRRNIQRLYLRALWQRYFQDFDAFLLPVLPVPAFPHDHSPQATRTLESDKGRLPYLQGLLAYMGLANLTGLPATVAQAGRTAKGLPVGIQILGPYLEDATPIRLAALLAREHGGFTPPPGY
jgi:amidase